MSFRIGAYIWTSCAAFCMVLGHVAQSEQALWVGVGCLVAAYLYIYAAMAEENKDNDTE